MHNLFIIRYLQKYLGGLSALLVLAFATGCGLQKDIDVELPAGPAQLVVECYLENNQIPRLTVSETTPYLADPTPAVPTDATVVLTYPDGHRETLTYGPGISRQGKAYTHIGKQRLTVKPGDKFVLDVTDTQGRHVTGTAIAPTVVTIDTLEWKFNDKPAEERQAYVLNTFQDPAGTLDFYRFQIHRNSLANGSEIDYMIEDRLNDGKKITLGTSYQFDSGDTLVVSLYHFDQPYYRYMQSVQNARNANGNPFAQPSAIQSTVQGGLGVFTVLSYQRKTIIIK
ncbi:DUF4249 domain-containing protein [Hymenobacter jejuensis]|uniref:DUF4249 domain-containing protein n=1 Tax=Hymenobacter jejuensis TaxID=2502781 RepID=A0A5B7ZWB1_9BACT|nr:DUF4249 domain-containing protein [Hymenobacter jejuensis]QDA59137.1 DUF4249 domain-containing protein [Hymenobacter jejuensis]